MDDTEEFAVRDCTRCETLVASRSCIVNGTGAPDAAVAFVGEAPGAREDEEGDPFVGRSGEVLDGALADAGLARETVRITNCVRCRPPENRDPTAAELGNCREYLDAELAVVDPAVVVTLGKVPAEHLLDRSVAVTAEAGDVERTTVGGAEREVLISVHPAATLYDPDQRETFAATIEAAATMVGAGGGQSRLDEF